MKKILILMLLGVAFSFGAFAGDGVKKGEVRKAVKQHSKAKTQVKLYIDLCIEAEVFIGECADGTVFVGAVAYLFVDCESGNLYGAMIDCISSVEESC
jgi:hypothetical protein